MRSNNPPKDDSVVAPQTSELAPARERPKDGATGAGSAGGFARGLALRLWIATLLLGGLLLLIEVIIPNMTPTSGVLNASKLPVGIDFIALYSAGTLLDEGRAAAAYNDEAIGVAESSTAGTQIKMGWPYPPGNLPLAGALATLPYLPALAIWTGVSLAGLGLVLWKISGRLDMALLLPLFPAVSYSCMHGKTAVAAAALAGGGLWLLPRNPAVAGILLGFVTLKPQLAFLLPFCLLAAGEMKALAYFLGTGVALELIGLAVGGPAAVMAFLTAAGDLPDRVIATPTLFEIMPTVFIGLTAAGLPAPIAIGAQVLISIATIAIVCFVWRRSRDPLRRALVWVAGVPLAVHHIVDYDLVIFAIPLAYFAAAAGPRIRWVEAVVITLLWSMAVLVSPIAVATGQQLGAIAAAALLAYAVTNRATMRVQ